MKLNDSDMDALACVLVLDNTAPNILVQDVIVSLDATGSGSTSVVDASTNSIDNYLWYCVSII
jgi:hypothetical protein